MSPLTTPALRTLRRSFALVAVFTALLLAVAAAGQDRPETYEIQRGDTFSRIARRFGCSVAELRAANPELADANSIYAGDTLTIPACEGPSPPAPQSPSDGSGGGGTYVIRAGDYLERIAEEHGCSVAEIMSANDLDSDVIYAGRTLDIPTCTPGEPSSGPAGEDRYVIQPGDYLGAIAHLHGCSISELRAANGLTGDLIRAGDTLVIPECTGLAARAISREVDTRTLPRLMAEHGFREPRRFRALVVGFTFDSSRSRVVGERWYDYEGTSDDDAWNPASTVKLFAAVAALREARDLGFSGLARVTFHGRGGEHTFTLNELVQEALGPSNNIAYNFLVQFVGFDGMNGEFFSRSNGFSGSAVRRAYEASRWMEMGESSSFRDAPSVTLEEGSRTRTIDARRGTVDPECSGAACTTLRDLAECMRRLMLQEQLDASETYRLPREDLLTIRLALRSDRLRGEEVVENLAHAISGEGVYFYHKAGYAGSWYSDTVYIYDPHSTRAWIVALAGYPGRDSLNDAARIIGEIITAGELD